MNIKVRLLHDRVLVEPIEQEERTKGGIIIPDTAQEKPIRGKVVAVGEGRIDERGTRQKPDVKVGDVVMFVKWGGTEVKIDSKEYLLMKEGDIFMVIG